MITRRLGADFHVTLCKTVNMDAPQTPENNVGHAVCSCVLPKQNHIPIGSLDDLGTEQQDNLKGNLKDVVFHAKVKLMGPGCPAPNNAEMDRFLVDVFDMWSSSSSHDMPDEKTLTPGISDKAVAIGTLDEDVPTEKKIEAELKRRNLSTKQKKSRALKHLVTDHKIETHSRERMKGAVVKIRASLKNGSEVSILYGV